MWEKIGKIGAKASTFLIGGAAGLLGPWNALLTTLAALMVLDYLTGLVVPWCGKSPKTETGGVSSKVGFIGLAKKAFIIVIVLLATLLDRAINTGAMVWQTAATCFYIANEGLSVLENAALMGVPVPGAVTKALELFRKKSRPRMTASLPNT